jgi:hypothetical protein
MKHVLKVTVFAVLTGFILASCSGLSVMKRRYTKGFFVEHRGKPAKEKSSVAQTPVAKQEPVEKVATQAIRHETPRYTPQAEVKKQHLAQRVTARAGKPVKNNVSPSMTRDIVDLTLKHPVKAIDKTIGLLKNGATSDDALSLLWIVIVVILIIYLVGLLLDWGGGGLIHLLGVIALVLLILWLLKII